MKVKTLIMELLNFCETTKDEKGNYIDSYTYEIINRRCDNAN